jgi:hypothetical protein
MHHLNKLINLIFGTNRPTEKFIMPSKQRLMRNALREYGARDW